MPEGLLSRNARTFLLLSLIAIIMLFFFVLNNGGITGLGSPIKDISQAQLIDDLTNKRFSKADIDGPDFSGTYADGTRVKARLRLPPSDDLNKALDASSVVKVSGSQINDLMAPILMGLLIPVALVLGFYFFIYRPAQQTGNQAIAFGRSRAKRLSESVPKTTFEDVAGVQEAKEELYEIVDFLRNKNKYVAVGAKIPKGVLLLGPPGCGKTLLARAVAGEAGVPFFHISGSDFVEMFVGVGAARVRDLFETAKAHRPSLIFVDEIDAVGRQRGAGLGGGHDEREQTLNQLLVEMDGFDPNLGVILIAATNRPDVLDPALLRPGRFDRQIVVDAPDADGREAILKVHSKGKPLGPDVDLEVLAKRTPGMTGADLANVLNEAALLTARNDKTAVGRLEVESALDRVIAGPERRSRILNEHEREVVAYHEAGHAIVGELLEHCDPVHKLTILPRGMSLGTTWQLPQERRLQSKSELLDDITMLLGGRVAEEKVFNEVTTGAQNDLQRVTDMARAMVCEFGMSQHLGTLTFGKRHGNPFLGRDIMEDRNYSEEVAQAIDREVRDIVEQSHSRATELLTARRESLDNVVQALLAEETLDRERLLAILHGTASPVDNKLADRLTTAEPPISTETPGDVTVRRRPKGSPGLEPGPA